MRAHPLSAFGAFLLDLFFLVLALLAAAELRFGGGMAPEEWERTIDLVPLALASEGVALYLAGAYRRDPTRLRGEDLLEVVRAVVAGGVLLVFFAFFARLLATSRYILLAQVAFAAVFLSVWRGAVGLAAEALRRRGVGLRDAVVVCDALPPDEATVRYARRLAEAEGYRIRFASVDEAETGAVAVRPGETVFVVAEDPVRGSRAVARLSGRPGVSVLWAPPEGELLAVGAGTFEVAGRPVLDLGVQGGVSYLPTKRIFDILLALLLLPVAVVFIALAGLAVWLESGRPIFYRQLRIGRDGKPFVLWKIRTMRTDAPAPPGLRPGETAPNDPRVTRVGRFLRRFSLDEWPQIFHILRGEMSFVGPRPEVPEVVATYGEWERRILEAPPGLTGLVQVSGRDDLSEVEKRRLDLYYLRHRTLAMDLVILARTLVAVFLSPGRA